MPEYARDYLNSLGRPYRRSDLLHIARGQYLWERYAAHFARRYLFSDTSMLVMKVWSDYRFGRTHRWISEQLCRQSDSLFLLCAPDIPWEADPLRENPGDRQQLFAVYERELRSMALPYTVISGPEREERLRQAVTAVDNFQAAF